MREGFARDDEICPIHMMDERSSHVIRGLVLQRCDRSKTERLIAEAVKCLILTYDFATSDELFPFVSLERRQIRSLLRGSLMSRNTGCNRTILEQDSARAFRSSKATVESLNCSLRRDDHLMSTNTKSRIKYIAFVSRDRQLQVFAFQSKSTDTTLIS